MMALSGVRNSWLMVARNSLFDLLAWFASFRSIMVTAFLSSMIFWLT